MYITVTLKQVIVTETGKFALILAMNNAITVIFFHLKIGLVVDKTLQKEKKTLTHPLTSAGLRRLLLGKDQSTHQICGDLC